MLAFINTLEYPEMVGVNPEMAHEHMAGLNFLHAVAQAWEAGKLFHIDLNDQNFARYDQDFRFGAQNYKQSFFLVKLLEDVGYQGPRHFDAHAYRTEDSDGVKAFARGCMRSYLILKEKVACFHADPEIQSLLREFQAGDPDLAALAASPYSRAKADALKARPIDRETLGRKGYGYEHLDQLIFDLLMGVR
jgi:xylose isomerase